MLTHLLLKMGNTRNKMLRQTICQITIGNLKMNNFKVGNVVYLKSGSVAMTITSIDDENCNVTWHDYESKKHYARYPHQTLTKENPHPISTPPAKVGF